jgi:hypothetical protein
MPSNEEHRQGAKKIAILLVLGLPTSIYWYTGNPMYSLLGIIPALTYRWFIGIPDIDSESSIPRRHLRLVVLTSSFVGVVYTALAKLDLLTQTVISQTPVLTSQMSLLVVGFGSIITGVGVGKVADWKLSILLPKHRGILHSPLLYIGVGLPTVYALHKLVIIEIGVYQIAHYAITLTLLSAIFWSLVHISQDKLY